MDAQQQHHPRRRRFSVGSSDLRHPSHGLSPNTGNDLAAAAAAAAVDVAGSRRRPLAFVNLEFGLSLSSARPLNIHSFSYQSRALRDKKPSQKQKQPQMAPSRPRKAAASTARRPPAAPEIRMPSYDDYYYYQYLHNRSQQRSDDPLAVYQDLEQHHLLQRHATAGPSLAAPGPSESLDGRRSSRHGHSSWERGHSAPPPLSTTDQDRWQGPDPAAWLSNAEPWGEGPFGEGPSSRPRGHPRSSRTAAAAAHARLSKPLPDVPSHFRLGEGPWLAGPDADPDDERLRRNFAGSPFSDYHYWSPESDDSLPSHPVTAALPPHPLQLPPTNTPTVLPIEAVARRRSTAHALNVDPQRDRELEALSAAMATVDNGFENQWWNQGGRVPLLPPGTERLAAALPLPITALPPPIPPRDPFRPFRASHPPRPVSLGWAVTAPMADPFDLQGLRDSLPPSTALSPPRQPRTPTIARSNSERIVSSVSLSSSPSTLSGNMSAHINPRRDDSLFLRHHASTPLSALHTVSPVSPVSADGSVNSAAAFSPESLNRSLTTRSDELFFNGARYA